MQKSHTRQEKRLVPTPMREWEKIAGCPSRRTRRAISSMRGRQISSSRRAPNRSIARLVLQAWIGTGNACS